MSTGEPGAKTAEPHAATQIPPLSELLDAAADAWLVFDAGTGDLVEANAAACASLGLSRNEFAAANYSRIEGDGSRAGAWPRLVSKTIRQGRLLREHRWRTLTGDSIDVEVNWSHYDHNGRSFLLAVARELPARHRRRDERAALADELMTIVRMLPDVLFSCKKAEDGKIYWTLNEGKLAEEFHVTTEEIVGKPLEELFPGGASEKIKIEFERAFNGEAAEFINEMGGRYFKHFPQPVMGPDGKVEKVVGFITDVTTLHRAQDEIEKLNDSLANRIWDLNRTNKELESFAYSVSHDLRTPLTIMDSMMQVVDLKYGENLDEGLAGHLDRIRRAIDRMNRIITDLLNLSRSTSLEVRREAVDMSAAATRILSDLQQRDPTRVVDVSIQSGVQALADGRFTHVILDNLLRNAWKYSAKKQRAQIEFGRTQEGGESVYFVRDDGAGFDGTTATNVFQAFRRMHDPSQFQGTGIGLATVQRIIQRHKGRIWYDAEVDKGATFFFTLGADDT